VVEVAPASARREEAASDLCIVVDAETGKVIGRWPGMADRPDRGPDARGARPDPTRAPAARASASTNTLLRTWDASNGSEITTRWEPYAAFRVSGDPRVSRWPEWDEGPLGGVTRTALLDAVSANARNVARTICEVRGYCGTLGGFDRTSYSPWDVAGNLPPGDVSRINRLRLNVMIADNNVMDGDGDPNQPSSDWVAHEFGHIMDAIYAGDRSTSQSGEGDSVEEALADMFAYDYDWGDPTIGEEGPSGVARNWAIPGARLRDGQPYPAHMDDYDDTPPDGAPHFNSTILSHAYYLFVQRVGRQKAGRVLHNVPQRLSPRPTFGEVRRSFSQSAHVIYGATVSAHAIAAFTEVGLAPPPHREPNCGPDPC
jgi:hypothetical protein